MADLCRHCNRPESEHHAFEARGIPNGCVCSASWPRQNRIPPVCHRFDASNSDVWCVRCEHDEACHAPKD